MNLKDVKETAKHLFDALQDEIETEKIIALIAKTLRNDRINVAIEYRKRQHALLSTCFTYAGETTCTICGRKCHEFTRDASWSLLVDLDAMPHGEHCIHKKLKL